MTSGVRSYLIINLVFAGVVIGIIAYSGIFSPEKNRYPVECVHETLTGMPCPSCGLSHSFSYIVRGDLDNAFIWNRYGLRVFLFFVIQLIMRISISLSLLRSKASSRSLLRYDLLITILSFILGFNQFIAYNFRLLF